MSSQASPTADAINGDEDTLIPNVGLDKTAVPQPPSLVATAVLGSTAAPGGTGAPSSTALRTTQARTTVLPTFTGVELRHTERERYLTVRKLGEGGMGEVSLAQDQDIDRQVAVKYLHPNLADPGMVARFVEEIRTVGHLEHPNIVPIHDVGLDEQGRYFFVMKHLDGETLESIIEKLRAHDPAYEARYSFERRAEIIVGVLQALRFSHAKGIIHRDLKPANIMVGKHGEVVVMDWGIAKAIGKAEIAGASAPAPIPSDRLVQTQLGALIGTPMYMAPEQAAGRSEVMDARSDLYSVSAMLWELMSLQHYLGDPPTIEAVLQGIQTAIPDPKVASAAPASYRHAVVKGLQKDPAQRYQSAEEFIDRLHLVQDGLGPVCCPVSGARRATGEVAHFLDKRPDLSFWLTIVGTPVVLGWFAFSVVAMVHWFHG